MDGSSVSLFTRLQGEIHQARNINDEGDSTIAQDGSPG
jgi:hypothetical protein